MRRRWWPSRFLSRNPSSAFPVQALLLSVGRGLPPTLVLPSGSYQPERVLELRMEGGIRRIRLSGLAGRGYDYDRAAFSASA